MYANAAEALTGLRRKMPKGERTGEVLPTRIIANNTKLVYFADECIGLQFHKTLIAMYLPDGVVIDTRDANNPNGWWTISTWDRIDSFTPARTLTRDGLRQVAVGEGWSDTPLFVHGAKISPDGTWSGLMDPATDAAVRSIANGWRRKLRNYAKRLTNAYLRWDRPPECCTATILNNADSIDHCIGHFRANEPVLNVTTQNLLDSHRHRSHGDEFVREATKAVASNLIDQLIPRAIEQVAPEFPYPQLTRG